MYVVVKVSGTVHCVAINTEYINTLHVPELRLVAPFRDRAPKQHGRSPDSKLREATIFFSFLFFFKGFQSFHIVQFLFSVFITTTSLFRSKSQLLYLKLATMQGFGSVGGCLGLGLKEGEKGFTCQGHLIKYFLPSFFTFFFNSFLN